MKELMGLWQETGFELWSWRGMEGVYRRVTFRKDSLLGEVASYYADDYIVWKHRGQEDEKLILNEWKPQTDVMNHRFLLVDSEGAGKIQRRAFWYGIKGWVTVLRYCPGNPEIRDFKDLIFLTNKGSEYLRKGGA